MKTCVATSTNRSRRSSGMLRATASAIHDRPGRSSSSSSVQYRLAGAGGAYSMCRRIIRILELACLEGAALSRKSLGHRERPANPIGRTAEDDLGPVRADAQRSLTADALRHHGNESQPELGADERERDAARD